MSLLLLAHLCMIVCQLHRYELVTNRAVYVRGQLLGLHVLLQQSLVAVVGLVLWKRYRVRLLQVLVKSVFSELISYRVLGLTRVLFLVARLVHILLQQLHRLLLLSVNDHRLLLVENRRRFLLVMALLRLIGQYSGICEARPIVWIFENLRLLVI